MMFYANKIICIVFVLYFTVIVMGTDNCLVALTSFSSLFSGQFDKKAEHKGIWKQYF